MRRTSAQTVYALLLGCLAAPAARAVPLAYKFAGDAPTYHITCKSDMPDGPLVWTGYVRYAPVVAGTQIALPYKTAFQSAVPENLARRSPYKPPAGLFRDSTEHNLIIHSNGEMVRRPDDLDAVPMSLDAIWVAPLPPLPDDERTSWSETVDAPLGTAKLPARRTVKYTLADTSGDRVTVKLASDLSTDEKAADGSPSIQSTGAGSFVFDTARGLMVSMDASYKITTKVPGKTISIPGKVSLRLLGPDEVAALKADAEVLAAKSPETDRPPSGRADAERTEELPEGVTKTQSMGGNGGSPFVKIDENKRPVIGFHIKISEWGGKGMLGGVEPLYEAPTKNPASATAFRNKSGDEIDVLAKDGYAVGGAFLSGPDYARAIRVIFMKKTATGLDPKQSYVSPWYGGLIGEKRVRVGGTGKFVAGVFGRQGMNTDQFGLLMYDTALATPSKPAGPKDPTDDPNFGAAKP